MNLQKFTNKSNILLLAIYFEQYIYLLFSNIFVSNYWVSVKFLIYSISQKLYKYPYLQKQRQFEISIVINPQICSRFCKTKSNFTIFLSESQISTFWIMTKLVETFSLTLQMSFGKINGPCIKLYYIKLLHKIKSDNALLDYIFRKVYFISFQIFTSVDEIFLP